MVAELGCVVMTAPEPYYQDESVTLYLGDCLDVLRTLEADSIDAIVTDPPAGIAFMDREWDDFRRARNPADVGRDNVFGRTSAHGPEYGRRDRSRFVGMLTERLAEAYRVLKPGGHALVWSIPRTSHWTAWAIEDAGFDIRDCIPHLFGSGFPKSLDVSKAIDKAAGAEREVVGTRPQFPDGTRGARARPNAAPEVYGDRAGLPGEVPVTAPATEDAARWEGWGTALKPGQEMWWLARKPLAAGTVAANVLQFGTGALNIAGCKVGTEARVNNAGGMGSLQNVSRVQHGYREHVVMPSGEASEVTGRWPTNIVFTHSAACEPIGLHEVRSDGHHPAARGAGGLGTSGHAGQDGLTERKSGSETVEAWACADDCPVGELDAQSGIRTDTAHSRGERQRGIYGPGTGPSGPDGVRGFTETGGASRFYPTFRYQAKAPASERPRLEDGTAHETVKPLGLISWLVRFITPPGGTVLDMFAGSGPVGESCIIEGFRCVLIEKELKSAELIKPRLSKPIQPVMFGLEAS
jgi:hypothetical protein